MTALAWRNLPPALYILTYHRVGDWHATPYDAGTFTCDGERFRHHLCTIKDRFEVIDLDRLLREQQLGSSPTRPLALITFDDGYRDNYQAAFPILKDLGLSAVFFLPTSFVGTSRVPWWDEVAWVIRQSKVEHIELPGLAAGIALAGSDVERTIVRVLGWVKKNESIPVDERVQLVRKACAVTTPATNAAQPLFMTWDEARTMHAAGMGIGSHTHTHQVLSQLSAKDQEQELSRSKEILEGELRAPVDTIAYPVGRSFCYTQETRAIARRVGYRIGFNHTNATAKLPASDALDVSRLVLSDQGAVPQLQFAMCFPTLNA
jgi:peptidoglycan/xylan/chitin deacetylase (PgdA/CDA1 family)